MAPWTFFLSVGIIFAVVSGAWLYLRPDRERALRGDFTSITSERARLDALRKASEGRACERWR